jgi:NOL1/NOP2/fmu family ribosome biogenesis protein
MCTPLAAIGAGLSIAGQVANHSAQTKAAQQHNTAVLRNAQDASLAASHKYEDSQRRYVYDARQTQQEGYKAVMDGRRAAGTAMASAASSGFDASSISVSSILAGIDQQTALSVNNSEAKFDDLRNAYVSQGKTIEAEAQGRTNSMSMKAGPSPLGLAIGIGGSMLDGAKAGGMNFGTLFTP